MNYDDKINHTVKIVFFLQAVLYIFVLHIPSEAQKTFSQQA